MTFDQLKVEFYARGFDYLNQDAAGQLRAARWLNQSLAELSEYFPWPWLQTTSTGTAPLTFTDLRSVLSVADVANDRKLEHIDRRTLTDMYSDLTTTGNPEFFYFEGEILKVYPANTSITLTIRYVKTPTDLSAASDEPAIPTRFQDLIVDGAVIKALKDSDNYEAMMALRAEYDRGVQQMISSLGNRNYGSPDHILATTATAD